MSGRRKRGDNLIRLVGEPSHNHDDDADDDDDGDDDENSNGVMI